MTNILCTIDSVAKQAKKNLDSLGTVTYTEPSQEKFAHVVSDVEVIVMQLGLKLTKEVIDAAPKLKCVATATTGLDHIDTVYAESKGITILSLKDETEFLNTITSTAELAMGLLISLMRHIPAAHTSVLLGNWERETFRGNSLRGKTLGIIGYGRLGKMMARFGEAMGMNVIFTDPKEQGGVTPEKLFASADFISIHVHLNNETAHSVGKKEFAQMKAGVLIINTARGRIVDETALIDALSTGTVGGYATDVLSDELSFENDNAKSALIDYAKEHRNVIITPHIGGTTIESREATDIFIVEKLAKHL